MTRSILPSRPFFTAALIQWRVARYINQLGVMRSRSILSPLIWSIFFHRSMRFVTTLSSAFSSGPSPRIAYCSVGISPSMSPSWKVIKCCLLSTDTRIRSFASRNSGMTNSLRSPQGVSTNSLTYAWTLLRRLAFSKSRWYLAARIALISRSRLAVASSWSCSSCCCCSSAAASAASFSFCRIISR